jgi:outer membrane immunogenic protein
MSLRAASRKENVVMGRFLSGAMIVALTAATPAFAADLRVKAPAMSPAQFSWTGCHIGGHIGGVSSNDTTTNVFGVSRSDNSSGFVGGGQIGCDYQFAPGWVLGVEGQAAWTSLKSNSASAVRFPAAGVTVPSQFTVSNDFLASATARLGYSFVDRRLLYVKGGAAWTNEKVDDAFTNLLGMAVDPSTSTTRTGWTIGAGAEWAFVPNWSATLEYDYYDFGSMGLTLTAPNQAVTVNSLKDTIQTVTAGVNYRF